ncbi:MAG: hypothetical protein HVN35_09565 [Methanobacteriaceae archaeon]|nr:hypothetical protein [Methanobacteriaceae archaeon]
MATQKVKTNMNIERDLLKELKILANSKETTQTEIINQLLKKGIMLEKEEKKQKKTKGDNFLKLAGIVTAKKPFSATEEVKKLRNGEL